MRYIKKIPQTDQKLSETLLADGWRKIKEAPNLYLSILFSIPFMILNALISYLIIASIDNQLAASIREIMFSGSWSITIRFDYIIYAYILIILHEAAHLLFIPNFLKSEKTYFGIKPWGGFVFTTEPLTKGRFLLISVTPFLLISVILPVILGLIGNLSSLIVFTVFLNALASSVDMLNTFLIAVQVPQGSTIVNNGFESYYVSGEPPP
ncbi:MAG: DUF3267 domain-containing protein [Bacillota bacterium]|nr:DUF3267 domain-containing protein [Bacillota bacterium]